MTSRHRPITRLALLAGILMIASTGSPGISMPTKVTPGIAVVDNLDSIRPTEVRLRKLHLVRPDLIPYPIEYEVVC